MSNQIGQITFALRFRNGITAKEAEATLKGLAEGMGRSLQELPVTRHFIKEICVVSSPITDDQFQRLKSTLSKEGELLVRSSSEDPRDSTGPGQ